MTVALYTEPFVARVPFSSLLERQSKKIGPYRLPTHSQGAHRNFFIIPSYFKIEILNRIVKQRVTQIFYKQIYLKQMHNF